MNLREIIYQKELSLLDSKNRRSSSFLRGNLTSDFLEFGSSGETYTLEDIIRRLKCQEEFKFEVSNFNTNHLSKAVILATYKIMINCVPSNRSSIWILEDSKWKMRFHQGTSVPTNKDANDKHT